jgi:hypothetical protein
MNNPDHRPSIVHDNQASRGPRAGPGGGRTLALVIAVLAALFAIANWMQPGPPARQATSDAIAAEQPDARSEFVYYPSQYTNQATEATEHIQAF